MAAQEYGTHVNKYAYSTMAKIITKATSLLHLNMAAMQTAVLRPPYVDPETQQMCKWACPHCSMAVPVHSKHVNGCT